MSRLPRLALQDFKPTSKLVTKITHVDKPCFPVIDAHNHLMDPYGGGWDHKPIRQLIGLLDIAGIKEYWDMDGGWGEKILENHLKLFKNRYPERFRLFGGVDWSGWEDHPTNFGEWASKRLKAQRELGADGLKVWKKFGLEVRDPKGKLVRVNDRRLDPLWETAGHLHMPVLIHVADPVAFFDPLDGSNERWEELHAHPDWQFPSPPFPHFNSILNDLRDLVLRHRQTIFIGAHVGCYAENLYWVGAMLRKCPNFFVDIAGRIGELGRQPASAKHFFTTFPDRILFGSDMGPDVDTYRVMYRFLESDDEYFSYGTDETPSQGRWQIYGLALPKYVLRKIYYENAQKIMKAGKR
jgi:predicted TIM-barrel fold metal-dependent hydrolase